MSTTFSPRAWAIFLLVVAADVLDLLSTTVTNVAAPTVVRDLGASWSLAPGSARATRPRWAPS
ncbi:hypothetical protein ACFY05_35505 [Microtetraspora fusca]|uniref:MFS transporter n=1 Tax=Microtetraspora fusca TaxID=1997 RepID=A0ABW6VJ38_MICFU